MPNSYMNLKSCFHFYYVIDVGSVFSGLVFVLHAPACVRSLYGYFHCVVAVIAVYGVDCGGKSGLLSAVDSVEKVALNCAGGADVPDYHARFLVEKRGGRVPLRAQRADSHRHKLAQVVCRYGEGYRAVDCAAWRIGAETACIGEHRDGAATAVLLLQLA